MLTLSEVLRDRAERDGDRVMFDFADRSFTYREVQARADTWQLILSDAGAEPGTRIVFLSANRPEFVFAIYGALQLGAAAVLCSPAWKAGEIAHACGVVTPQLAVADASGRTTLAEAAPELATLALEDPPVL
jgi:long-chain acyl-CoA synthetase